MPAKLVPRRSVSLEQLGEVYGVSPKTIPDWESSEPYWPKGAGFGEWRHEQGQWVFYPVSGN